MSGLSITGTGSYLPERCISNEGLACLYEDLDPQWIKQNLGISERRIAHPSEQSSDLAVNAARVALKDAGCHVDEIDLLIVATATPDRAAPATATIVAEKLDMPSLIAFDLAAVCSGFLFAMATATQYLKTGMAQRALVIGADVFSRITDWTKRDAGFFGDGAGAIILERCDTGSALPSDMRVIGGTSHFTVPTDMPYFTMNASAVARSAGEGLAPSLKYLFDKTGHAASDIDLVIPHQPSRRLLQKVAQDNGLDWDKFHLTMDRFANTAGATIPITLQDARDAGRVRPGTCILFFSAGAGMSAGSALYRWQ